MGAYLSTPVTEKISINRETKKLKYGASSMQGWRVAQEVRGIPSSWMMWKLLLHCYCLSKTYIKSLRFNFTTVLLVSFVYFHHICTKNSPFKVTKIQGFHTYYRSTVFHLLTFHLGLLGLSTKTNYDITIACLEFIWNTGRFSRNPSQTDLP